ncbi:MAG: O-antigen ligase family protein [Pirellulaceae bacterium]|nr:O-antigen ligase family protein [Pirellulaceae bacterium]
MKRPRPSAGRQRAEAEAAAPAKTLDGVWPERVRRGCVACLVALLVATPLVPSEAVAQQGTGAILVTLWMLLLTAWMLLQAWTGQAAVRVGWTLAAVLVLLLLHSLSGLVCLAGEALPGGNLSGGNGRAALNMVWQWISFGTAFFLIRQLIWQPAAIRGLLAVLLGLAVTLSAHGVYQYFVVLPGNRAAYERDPDETLRRMGVVAPAGSPERKQLEDRLYSVEPTATFALTNSLASFLSPLLVLAAGIGLAARSRWREDRAFLAGLGLILLPGLACLLLTKSRTAFVATLSGAALLPAMRIGRLGLGVWPIVLLGVAIVGVLLGGAVVAGGLDLQVLSEALKSLLYRLEYWQATLRMIADRPWWGCGPGNFQTCYTAYKLPQSSETVADPHNFLLEIWATAGTPALLGFLAIAVAAVVEWRAAAAAASRGAEPVERPETTAIHAGAGLGLLLAYPGGWLNGYPLDWIVLPLGLLFGAATTGLLRGWIGSGPLTAGPLWAALAVLLINLLAAGGIGFPGVAQSGWVLLALALNLAGPASVWRPGRAAAMATAAGVGGLAALCIWTLYQPVLQSEAQLAQGSQWRASGRPREAAEAFAAAARSDPFSSAPWMHLAQLHHELYLRDGSPEDLRAWEQAAAEAQRRDPRSSAQSTQFGRWYLAGWLRRRDARLLDLAIESFLRAARLYPSGSMERAQLAWTLHLRGDADAAAEAAELALELDRANPHAERRLARRTLAGDPGLPGLPDLPSAEQRMRQLRTGDEPSE